LPVDLEYPCHEFAGETRGYRIGYAVDVEVGGHEEGSRCGEDRSAP